MVLLRDQILLVERIVQRFRESRCEFVDKMLQRSRILPPGEEIKRLLEWAGTGHCHGSTKSKHRVWGALGRPPVMWHPDRTHLRCLHLVVHVPSRYLNQLVDNPQDEEILLLSVDEGIVVCLTRECCVLSFK